MNIKEITTYKIDGKEFTSLSKVKNYVENKIGTEFISGFDFHYKQKLAFLEYLTKKENRAFLNEYLNIKYEYHDCNVNSIMGEQSSNILDF